MASTVVLDRNANFMNCMILIHLRLSHFMNKTRSLIRSAHLIYLFTTSPTKAITNANHERAGPCAHPCLPVPSNFPSTHKSAFISFSPFLCSPPRPPLPIKQNYTCLRQDSFNVGGRIAPRRLLDSGRCHRRPTKQAKQRFRVRVGQRWQKVPAGPSRPHGPITQLSPSLTRNRCAVSCAPSPPPLCLSPTLRVPVSISTFTGTAPPSFLPSSSPSARPVSIIPAAASHNIYIERD